MRLKMKSEVTRIVLKIKQNPVLVPHFFLIKTSKIILLGNQKNWLTIK